VKQRDDRREGKFRQGDLRSTAGQCSEKDADQSIVRGREPPPRRGTHQSLERGLQVLETIATTGSLISLGEASRRTGLQRKRMTQCADIRLVHCNHGPLTHCSLPGHFAQDGLNPSLCRDTAMNFNGSVVPWPVAECLRVDPAPTERDGFCSAAK
jgi:hypothetical protein